MGLFLCDVCDQQVGLENHVCNPEKIKSLTAKLREQARNAEHKANEIQNAVFMLLQSSAPLDKGSDKVLVENEWLHKLWDAAKCQWWEHKTMDSFRSMWMLTHRILVDAFALFRSSKKKPVLEKLKDLKETCVQAHKYLYPTSSPLDLTEEQISGH